VHHNRALPVQVSGCYPVCCFLAHRVSSPLGATITGRGAVSPQNWCRFVTLRRYADPSPYTKQPATFTGRRVFLCPPTERKQHAHVSLRRRYALQPGGHRRTVRDCGVAHWLRHVVAFAATLKVEASTSVAGSRDSRPRSRVHGLPAREMDRAKDTRVAAPMQAIKEASGRISNMETNNADFRSKSARDRCLVLMRVTRCQTEAAINGSGYQLARFSDFVAVRAAAEDPTAGPATPQTTSSAAKMRPVGNSKGPTSS
jgi:hypothetical protein